MLIHSAFSYCLQKKEDDFVDFDRRGVYLVRINSFILITEREEMQECM